MHIEITILGSGTSTGVPMLGCQCEVCTSDDPHDQRYRASALLRWQDTTVVIDTTPEFRLQMLRAGALEMGGVLLTHTHADHIHGFDDLRAFTLGVDRKIPVWGSPETLQWIEKHYSYIWNSRQKGGGLPKVTLIPVVDPFTINGVRVIPIPVKHGILDIYGYRLGDFAYISDVSDIPDASYALLHGLRTLVLDAVRYRPLTTHFNLERALAAARRIGAAHTYLTHMNHDVLHRRLEAELPPGFTPAYDGLVLHAAAQDAESRT